MKHRFINWVDERTGVVDFYHKQIAFELPEGVSYWHMFSGLTIGCIMLQFITGFYMLWYFVPEPALAHQSIRAMCRLSFTGMLMRNMHRWSATFGTAFIIMHALHALARRAYRSPRELNWWTGMALGIIFILFLITGVILPWDWRSYWELIIWADWANLLPVVGPTLKDDLIYAFSLGRNFAVHIMFLPALLFTVLGLHIIIMRRLGLSERV
jgi:menaquinol-cytochrome c reductase cytochrome b subunit